VRENPKARCREREGGEEKKKGFVGRGYFNWVFSTLFDLM
jgi:hypothetical protein